MSRAASSSRSTAGGGLPPPTAGALLRMTYQGIRERQFAALIGKGFDDLNQPLLNVFLYPPPDRMRPSELAERANMTKQAMNYLLGQLEARGYVERRAEREEKRGGRAASWTRPAGSAAGPWMRWRSEFACGVNSSRRSRR